MQRLVLAFGVLSLSLPTTTIAGADDPTKDADPGRITFAPTDWPWWRGPNRNGIAANQKPPLKWSDTEHVLWRCPVPGRGHGSPTVVGDQVFLATADAEKEIQSVLCVDRRTGRQLWQAEVHHGGFEKKGNSKASMASSTPACDGERVFINFLHDGAIWTTALSREANDSGRRRSPIMSCIRDLPPRRPCTSHWCWCPRTTRARA